MAPIIDGIPIAPDSFVSWHLIETATDITRVGAGMALGDGDLGVGRHSYSRASLLRYCRSAKSPRTVDRNKIFLGPMRILGIVPSRSR